MSAAIAKTVRELTDAGVTRPYENHVAYLTAKGALHWASDSAIGTAMPPNP